MVCESILILDIDRGELVTLHIEFNASSEEAEHMIENLTKQTSRFKVICIRANKTMT
ncbi:hypothetical protein [Wukongibacter baidiensis]